MLALVGESGSGKSLTSLASMQLIPNMKSHIDQGEIWYLKGEEKIGIHNLSEKEMQGYRTKEIAMIFQEPMTALNPSMTCGKQISEAIQTHLNLEPKAIKKRCLEWFESVELHDTERIYSSYPHQLSGGQKQRVMIAMALSCEPKILIADEPTTALDVTVQKEVLNLIKRLQKKHQMACLFISHDIELVRDVADKVAVMKEGEIVEYRIKNELFENPEHPYTKALLACKPDIQKNLKSLTTVNDFIDNSEFNLDTFYAQNEINIDDVKRERASYYTNKPLLEINGLTKVYEEKGFLKRGTQIKALDAVSLKLFKGESLGIVGESGCGKSTLSKCIIQLEKPSAGSILYQGEKVQWLLKKNPLRFRKKIQMIFQDPASALNPKMRIGDIITEVMQIHQIGANSHERKQKAIDLLEKTGLKAEHFRRYPHEFSGGQKQRIGIARALALEPEILICDESVSALDVSVQAQVLNLLNELKELFSLSYIFISHDLSVVKHFCDRIVVLNDGIVEEEAFSEELFEKAKSKYTQKLINAIPGKSMHS